MVRETCLYTRGSLLVKIASGLLATIKLNYNFGDRALFCIVVSREITGEIG